MKRMYKLILTTMMVLMLVPACEDILEEDPKASFTNDYFTTPQGAQQGLNTAHAYLRFQYGVNPALALNISGTDEFTYGEQPAVNTSGDNLPHRLFGEYDVDAELGFLTVTFNRTFPIINLLNGLLEYIPDIAGLTDTEKSQMTAQARYLRAHYYYFLVGQFGPTPLDLGSGELVFNTAPYAGFNRPTKDDVQGLNAMLKRNYEVMIEDLEFASTNLPTARPSQEFRLSQAVALHLLARISLFSAYSGLSDNAQADYQRAYDAAMEVIDNPGTYGVELLEDFGAAYLQSNEYNREIMFAAERIPLDNVNNEYTNPSGIGDRENMAANCFTSNYEAPDLRDGTDPIQGRALMFQRPLRKLSPTNWLLFTAFSDKVNDSRYHNSFRTLYTCQALAEPGTETYNSHVANLEAIGLEIGDTAFVMTDTDAQAASLMAKDLPYRAYGPSQWWTPSNPTYTPAIYPALKKFDDAQRATGNDASGRPMPIFKFGETYLLAAEAALQGNINGGASEAARLINIIRRRAAFRPSLNASQLATRQTNMEISAGDVDLNFILDERARELCGEGSRWTDLALRGEAVFLNRIQLNDQSRGNVQAYHRWRPIPQQHLDRINVTNPGEYQNPGY
ncbi:MAG: RagB/SusD family nutrient uptake outer membrane protein [Marinoscillum sp.]